MVPPMKTRKQLEELSRLELIEYAMDRQRAAYEDWERSLGDDL